MKEKHPWMEALFHGLRMVCVCLMGAMLLAAFTPGVDASAGEAADCPVGLFGWPGKKEAAGGGQQVRTLVPVGHTVGIKLFSDGVLVVGLGQVDTAQGAAEPAKSCGLREGDIITHINSREVDTIEEVQSILAESSGAEMSLSCIRNGATVELTGQAVQCSTDGSYKLGAWIRDSMAGIGTVTFVDPESGLFGALGHPISDVDTHQLMPLSSGAILHSSVTGVQKGQAGQPGQLRGTFDLSRDLGSLFANTTSGVFGTLAEDSDLPMTGAMPVATRSQVQVGPATILSNIDGEEVREYTVEITRIYPDSAGDSRDMLIKVTDPALLGKTGGIVQGMSGSPILQEGRLVGAVTHVLVNDPTQGYGILVEDMLNTAQGAA